MQKPENVLIISQSDQRVDCPKDYAWVQPRGHCFMRDDVNETIEPLCPYFGERLEWEGKNAVTCNYHTHL